MNNTPLSPMRFAHMGVRQYAPENTLEAYMAAAKLGCEGIELDINQSRDGEIICIHNSTLTYMTCGRDERAVKDLDAEQIKRAEIPYRDRLLPCDPPVPWTEARGGTCPKGDSNETRITHLITFKEFDDWLSTVEYELTVEVEFKTTGMCPRMDEILSQSKNVRKYILFSGQTDVLNEMQRHYALNGKPQGLRLGANLRFINDSSLDFISRSDLYEVGLNNEAFTRDDVKLLNDKGIEVFSNLGDYREWWSILGKLGAKAFKTNYPEAYTSFITSDDKP